MRIKRIATTDHPALGNFSAQLLDDSGEPFNRVIIAGANGTGKTSVLECIHVVFEGQLNRNLGLIELEIELSESKLKDVLDLVGLEQQVSSRTITIKFDSALSNWGAYQIEMKLDNGSAFSGNIRMNRPEAQSIFRSFYSEISVNFPSQNIDTIRASRVDTEDVKSSRSGPDLGTQISQLLIDVYAADNEDLSEWVRQNPGMAPPDQIKEVRFSRFRRAFDTIFQNKKFKGIRRENNSFKIEFIEFGRISTIDKLSTGEKQIVFRAGFILRERKAAFESIILIDEPETSLHPEWQSRILDFYTALLSDNNGRHPQIFVATHSPFIIHGTAGARTIILEKDKTSGSIREMKTPSYACVANSAAVYAFNIDDFLSKATKPLLVLTEGASDSSIIQTAWQKLYPEIAMPFECRDAIGVKNISVTLNDQQLFAKLGPRKILGLFDFDDAYNQWKGAWKGAHTQAGTEQSGLLKKHNKGPGWAMLLPVPLFRASAASVTLGGNSIVSIEFLFDDKLINPKYIGKKSLPLNQSLPYFIDSNKMTFSEEVKAFDPAEFSSFIPLFDAWKAIMWGQLDFALAVKMATRA